MGGWPAEIKLIEGTLSSCVFFYFFSTGVLLEGNVNNNRKGTNKTQNPHTSDRSVVVVVVVVGAVIVIVSIKGIRGCKGQKGPSARKNAVAKQSALLCSSSLSCFYFPLFLCVS